MKPFILYVINILDNDNLSIFEYDGLHTTFTKCKSIPKKGDDSNVSYTISTQLELIELLEKNEFITLLYTNAINKVLYDNLFPIDDIMDYINNDHSTPDKIIYMLTFDIRYTDGMEILPYLRKSGIVDYIDIKYPHTISSTNLDIVDIFLKNKIKNNEYKLSTIKTQLKLRIITEL